MIKNDMSMVKIGGTLNSIKSYNKNEVTHRKFEETVYDVYSEYKNSKERRKEFLDNVREYKIKYFKSTASKKDKLYVLFKLVARKDLKGIDNINYIKEVLTNVIGDDDQIAFEIFVSNEYEHPQPVIVINYFNDFDCVYYVIDVNEKDSIKQYDYNGFNKVLKYKILIPFTEQKMYPKMKPIEEGGRLVK
jgi:hypothetical protein